MSARRHLAALAVVPVLAASAVLVPATAAQAADSPGCVTRAEYKKAKKGMTLTRVHGIFDTKGHQESRASSGGYVFTIRSYRVCNSPYSAIAIGFEKNPRRPLTLSNKTAVWIS